MKAKKAKEILSHFRRDYLVRMSQDFDDALELALNALSKHIDRHTLTWAGMLLLLPGETPEDE